MDYYLELKKIKKLYGEEMMHFCRDNFPTILEKPGSLLTILQSSVAPTKMLIKDIRENSLKNEFREFIFGFFDNETGKACSDKTPHKLLQSVGYKLYQCKSNEQIKKFKKYYAYDEELCTFRGNRLDRNYVFFAVREDAKKLNRKDFTVPRRQDSYGTSVISIQFSKGSTNVISIKNRYNDTVDNPDATFSNNLDNIIPGLTDSFEKYYNLNIKNKNLKNLFENDLSYIKANDGKYYRYNCMDCGTYYCENNIIITDGNIIDKYNKQKERYILLDYFILDLTEKKIFLYDESIEDSFCSTINIGINKIVVHKFEKNKKILIYTIKGNIIKITLDETNNIIEYENNEIDKIEDNFLWYNKKLHSITLNNVLSISNNFLTYNECLMNISLPTVEKIGSGFLSSNEILPTINLPKIENIKNDFLEFNRMLNEINTPKLKKIGSNCLFYNQDITTIDFPNLISTGGCFLFSNSVIKSINIPNLEMLNTYFLMHNVKLRKVNLPNVKIIKYGALESNKKLRFINAPKLQEINKDNFNANYTLKKRLLKQITINKRRNYNG